ncbi:MAG: diguanylate cyclase [Pseudomonadota bacterium]
MIGTFLVVDPVPTARIALRAKLQSAHYQVSLAAAGTAALALGPNLRPDMIILGDGLADIDTASLCRTLRQQDWAADIPILVIASRREPAQWAAILKAGADDIIGGPVDDGALFARIRRSLSDLAERRDLAARVSPMPHGVCGAIDWGHTHTGLIGLVSKRPSHARAWQSAITANTKLRVETLDPSRILGRSGAEARHDVFVIDGDIGSLGDPLRFLIDLRARVPDRIKATVVLCSEQDSETAAKALDLGANGVFQGVDDAKECCARLLALMRRVRQAEHLHALLDANLAMALADPLTGLQNRRAGLQQLAQLRGEPHAVMMIDIDHFKSINDRYGHAAGDQVLVAVAGVLRQAGADAPICARIGGEEFLVAIPARQNTEAMALANALRKKVADQVLSVVGQALHVTVSIGVASLEPGEAVETTLARADRALYASKRHGRNRASLALEPQLAD